MFLMQLKNLKEYIHSHNELKKPFLWNCVLQVLLHIFLPDIDNVFEAFNLL